MTFDHQTSDCNDCGTTAPEPIITVALLPELPPSEWRSLGKRLDYANWADRQRFVELDAAIEVAQQRENARNAARQLISVVARPDGALLVAA